MVLSVHRNHRAYGGGGGMEVGGEGDYITWCLASTETIGLIRGGGGEGGMEVGGRGRLYTYRYTVTTRMTPALRWAAMRDILMFHNCEGQSQKTVSTDHNF